MRESGLAWVAACATLLSACAAPSGSDPVDAPGVGGAVGFDPPVDTDTGPPVDTDTASPVDTGPPGDTDTGSPVDTGVATDTGPGTSVDTAPPVDTAPTVDTAPPVDTAAPVDTAPSTDTAASPSDTALPSPDTGVSPGPGGGDTSPSTDTSSPADTSDTTDAADSASSSDSASSPDTAPPPDTASAADTGSTGPPPDPSSDTGDTGDTADTGAATATPIRFVALGDAGTGRTGQYDVANGIATVCAAEGCDFALYLGDNFYPGGVVDALDPQWRDKFEAPYAALSFPFYAILGNHDYGFGFDVSRAQAQIDYTALSSKWIMEDFYWTQEFGDVSFVGIDTMAIYEGFGAAQEAWLPGELAAIASTWKIALGHHPYLSNGPHGNAGEYEGIAGEGAVVQTFIEDYVCGQVDVYLCGHDHSLQWIEETCGTQFLVSGSGSSPSTLFGTNPVYFEDASLGFLWVEIDGRTFTGVFYDETGTELYRSSFTK